MTEYELSSLNALWPLNALYRQLDDSLKIELLVKIEVKMHKIHRQDTQSDSLISCQSLKLKILLAGSISDIQFPSSRAGGAVMEHSTQVSWNLWAKFWSGSIICLESYKLRRHWNWINTYNKGCVKWVNVPAECLLQINFADGVPVENPLNHPF